MDSLSSLPPVPDPRINPLIYYSISPDAAQWQLEHINDSKAGDILASLVVGFVLAYLAVTLRFVARRMKRTPYHIDDWLIVLAVVALTGYFIAVCLGLTRYNAGKHAILTMNPEGLAKAIIAGQCAAGPALCFAKLSTLTLYNRIFSLQRFRWLLYLIGSIFIATSLATILTAVFQCHPVNGAWNPLVPSKCIDLPTTLRVINSVNALTDFILLLAPLPHLWGLQMPKSTKLELTFLFSVGGFITGISIYRIIILHQWDREDSTWSVSGIAIWTMVELSFVIFCSSAITYRPLMNRVFGTRSPATPSAPADVAAAKRPGSGSSRKWTIGGGGGGPQGGFRRPDDTISVGSEEWTWNRSQGGDISRMGSVSAAAVAQSDNEKEQKSKSVAQGISVREVTSEDEDIEAKAGTE